MKCLICGKEILGTSPLTGSEFLYKKDSKYFCECPEDFQKDYIDMVRDIEDKCRESGAGDIQITEITCLGPVNE